MQRINAFRPGLLGSLVLRSLSRRGIVASALLACLLSGMAAGFRTSYATTSNDHDNNCTDITIVGGQPLVGGSGDIFTWDNNACSDCTEEEGLPEAHFVTVELTDYDTLECANANATGEFEIVADIYFCPPIQTSMNNFDIGSVTLTAPGQTQVTKDLKVVTGYIGGGSGTLIAWGRATWNCAAGVDYIPEEVLFNWGNEGTSQSAAAKGHVPDRVIVTVRCCTTGD